MRESVQATAATELGLVLEARDIAKRFGDREALKGVSLQASRGELVAIIGPNGAGKTTLLSILAGIQRADGGGVSRPPGEVGWVPQQAAVYGKLTVAENLRLFARLEKCPDVPGLVERMLAQTGLEERRDDPVAELSGGNRQRVNIAIGLLASPEVLLLDEPSAGLARAEAEALGPVLKGIRDATGAALVVVEHDVPLLRATCDRLIALDAGRIIATGTPAEVLDDPTVVRAYLGSAAPAGA